MSKKKPMAKGLQIHRLKDIFMLYNPDADIQKIDFTGLFDNTLDLTAQIANFARKEPGYQWYPPSMIRLDEKAVELSAFANYLETEYKEIPKKYRSLIERGELDEALALVKKLKSEQKELEDRTSIYRRQRDDARARLAAGEIPSVEVSDEEIEADIRRRAAVARKPKVPFYKICPVHRKEMVRVLKMPIITERGITAPPDSREMPKVFKIIRTRPDEIPPRMTLIPVPGTMEIYYCEEGNRFYERMNAKSKEQSAAFLLRKIERERARVARIAAPPGVRYYPPGAPAARVAERITIEKHEKWPSFLVQMGFTSTDYVGLDRLSKICLVQEFRKWLRTRGII